MSQLIRIGEKVFNPDQITQVQRHSRKGQIVQQLFFSDGSMIEFREASREWEAFVPYMPKVDLVGPPMRLTGR